MQGICSNNRHNSLTILDNILNLGESTWGEEELVKLTLILKTSKMEWEGK
jgi:hypothetical protein